MADCVEELRHVLFQDYDVHATENCKLIRKLSCGTQHFLHKLFNPLYNAPGMLKAVLGFEVEPSVSAMFLFSNGAILFDNTIFIYGITENFGRCTEAKDIYPISLEQQLKMQSEEQQSAGWFEIGSVATYSKNYSLQLCRNSWARISACDGSYREFDRFDTLILMLVRLTAQHIGPDGMGASEGQQLQQEIDALLDPSFWI